MLAVPFSSNTARAAALSHPDLTLVENPNLPTPLLRYTRVLPTETLRRQMPALPGYGLGMDLLALGE